VASAVGTTAHCLASADPSDLPELTKLIETARDARMATEQKNNATPEILQAWRKWYAEAVESLGRLQN
jgi:hypothetical protein